MLDEKSRRWCVTMWDFNKVTRIKDHLVDYGIFGEELAPSTGKMHYQGYLEFKKPYSFASVKRILNDKTAHVEMAVAHHSLCSKYCEKGGKIIWTVKKKCPTPPNLREEMCDMFDIHDGH